MPQPGSKHEWTWLYVLLSFVAAWVLYLTFFGPTMAVGLSPPQLKMANPPRPADFTWKLHDLDDHPVEFGAFRGKTIFLNIWATWCGPCREELPSIANLTDDPRLKDVAFVCVSTDQTAAPIRQYLKDKNWNMTVLRASDMPAGFTTDGIPATFLIAPDGTIAVAEVGAAQWDDPSVVALLERLTKPRPAAP